MCETFKAVVTLQAKVFNLSAEGILLDMQFLLGAYIQRLAEGTKLVFKRDISLSRPEVLLIKGYTKSVVK